MKNYLIEDSRDPPCLNLIVVIITLLVLGCCCFGPVIYFVSTKFS